MRGAKTQSTNTGFTLSLIENLKIWLVVKPLQFLCSTRTLDAKMEAMRNMPKDSVGYDLARLLDEHNLRLVPGFFEHDLNHLILGYGMGSEEELCMQAYLIGNRYYKWQCFVFLASAVIVPRLWPSLWRHFLIGRARPSVKTIEFEDCLNETTIAVQENFSSPVTEESELEFAV